MTFHDVNYEFWYIPAEDIGVSQDYAEGIAKGIQTVDVTGDYVTIKTYPDLCLEIANCIYGYGMFHAIEDEWKNQAKEYIETRFHWLKHYWSIYGARKPKLDLDFQQDIDEELLAYRNLSSGSTTFVNLSIEIPNNAAPGPYGFRLYAASVLGNNSVSTVMVVDVNGTHLYESNFLSDSTWIPGGSGNLTLTLTDVGSTNVYNYGVNSFKGFIKKKSLLQKQGLFCGIMKKYFLTS